MLNLKIWRSRRVLKSSILESSVILEIVKHCLVQAALRDLKYDPAGHVRLYFFRPRMPNSVPRWVSFRFRHKMLVSMFFRVRVIFPPFFYFHFFFHFFFHFLTRVVHSSPQTSKSPKYSAEPTAKKSSPSTFSPKKISCAWLSMDPYAIIRWTRVWTKNPRFKACEKNIKKIVWEKWNTDKNSADELTQLTPTAGMKRT